MHTSNSSLQPENPIIQSGSPSWKFLALAVVITALLAGLGGYLLGTYLSTSQSTKKAFFQPSPTITAKSSPTPTPDLIANWRTYTNTKYGYSIKYPLAWYIAIDQDQQRKSAVGLDKEDFIVLTPNPPCSKCGGYRESGIYIYAGKTTSQSSLDYVKQHILPDFPETEDSIKPFSLTNTDGTIVSGFFTAGCTGPNLYVVKNGIGIEIETECVDTETANQVFTSLKFTD